MCSYVDAGQLVQDHHELFSGERTPCRMKTDTAVFVMQVISVSDVK